LVKHILDVNDADLIMMKDIIFTRDQKAFFDDALLQLSNGRPLSKIIGVKGFYGRDFVVNDDVLDPRPDSELLIDLALDYCRERKDITPVRILDLGAGSGCLILTLVAEIGKMIGMDHVSGVAVDISDDALTITNVNTDAFGLTPCVEVIKSNWLDAVEGMFDIIVSNPPYINHDVIETLDKNVRDYDPMMALDGGDDGLNPYRVILPQIRTYMKKGAFFAVEHGYDQQQKIGLMFENEGFEQIRLHKDYANHDRVVTGINI